MFYVVIDTNVIVSGLLKSNSYPGLILSLIDLNIIIPLLHKDILNEYENVLKRPKFNFDYQKVVEILTTIKSHGIYVARTMLDEKLIDINDQIFYEIVMEHRKEAESYLVTGNIKHFPNVKYILTPKEFIEMLIFKSNI